MCLTTDSRYWCITDENARYDCDILRGGPRAREGLTHRPGRSFAHVLPDAAYIQKYFPDVKMLGEGTLWPLLLGLSCTCS